MSEPNELPPGTELIGQYTIKRVLGKGGFGIVYLADDNLGREVAIKEFFPQQYAKRDGDIIIPLPNKNDHFQREKEKIKSEARRIAQLNDTSIIKIITMFDINKTCYFVMEYKDGDNLEKIINNRPEESPFSEEELLEFTREMIDALAKVHKLETCHRDIKPENIYICFDGTPVIIDFGSARELSPQNNNLTIVTSDGYSPPEVYTGVSKLHGPWTDIFSLAAVLYKTITRITPHNSINRKARIELGETDPILNFTDRLASKYSNKFLEAILISLNVDHSKRPQTFDEFYSLLSGETQWLNEEQDLTPSTSPDTGNKCVQPDSQLNNANTILNLYSHSEEPISHHSDDSFKTNLPLQFETSLLQDKDHHSNNISSQETNIPVTAENHHSIPQQPLLGSVIDNSNKEDPPTSLTSTKFTSPSDYRQTFFLLLSSTIIITLLIYLNYNLSILTKSLNAIPSKYESALSLAKDAGINNAHSIESITEKLSIIHTSLTDNRIIANQQSDKISLLETNMNDIKNNLLIATEALKSNSHPKNKVNPLEKLSSSLSPQPKHPVLPTEPPPIDTPTTKMDFIEIKPVDEMSNKSAFCRRKGRIYLGVDHLICSVERLETLNDQLSGEWNKLKNSSPNFKIDLENQQTWIARYGKNCGINRESASVGSRISVEQVDCIANEILTRISEIKEITRSYIENRKISTINKLGETGDP
ncbi:MAG: serine/threonine protein kinase [Magnetococcales bacterium]|nr:serine/threonine protein kinase [Magnetococcales bacterium]